MGYRRMGVKPIGQNIFGQAHMRFTAPKISFSEFINEAWPILEPANALIPNWHIDLIAENLSLVTDGKIDKLLINMPPRNAKSNLVTILWPSWSWTLRPALRWIFCSYSASLSTKHSVDRRRIIESAWFQKNWGGIVRLSVDQNQKQEYENTARGHMISTSVGGTITGKGGDVIVEDDMLNPLEADSEAARRHSLDMHKNVLSTRLDNPKTGARVIVEQRTHDQDVSGYVLKNENGWRHLCLPLIADEPKKIIFPLSGRVVEREVGDLLIPDRQGKKEAEDMKRTMGTRTFFAQAQQKPTSEEGNILKRQWWRTYDELPSGFDIAIQSWDMSFKETKSGSFVVGQNWRKRGADFYLVDQCRDRMDFAATCTALTAFSGKHKEAAAIIVEDAANGPAIISTLKQKIAGIIAVPPHGSKLARAQAAAPVVESGNVYLPNPAKHPWVFDFIEECAAFKGVSGEINDQVDAFSQAITWLRQLAYAEVDIDDGLGDSFLLTREEQMVAGGFSV